MNNLTYSDKHSLVSLKIFQNPSQFERNIKNLVIRSFIPLQDDNRDEPLRNASEDGDGERRAAKWIREIQQQRSDATVHDGTERW